MIWIVQFDSSGSKLELFWSQVFIIDLNYLGLIKFLIPIILLIGIHLTEFTKSIAIKQITFHFYS